MPTQMIEIETPLETMMSPVIEGRKTVFVVIMRAGSGFLDGMLQVVPGKASATSAYRDPRTLVAVEYYFKMPGDMHERDAIVLDPMLATGNSAAAAVERLKETRPRSIRFVSLLAAPEGLQHFHEAHPDAGLHRGDRSPAQRPRLHRSRPRRRRRPDVRHQVSRADVGSGYGCGSIPLIRKRHEMGVPAAGFCRIQSGSRPAGLRVAAGEEARGSVPAATRADRMTRDGECMN